MTGRRVGAHGCLTAAVIAVGAALGTIAVATGALRLGKPADSAPSAEQLAQQRCQAEVLKRLVSPTQPRSLMSTPKPALSTSTVGTFSSLTASEPLKGVDVSRVSAC